MKGFSYRYIYVCVYMYIYIFRFLSHINYYKILNTVSVLYSKSLLFIYFVHSVTFWFTSHMVYISK